MLYDDNTDRLIQENIKGIAALAAYYAKADADLRQDLVGEGIVELLCLNREYNDRGHGYSFLLYTKFKIRDKMRAFVKQRGREIPIGIDPEVFEGGYSREH